MQTRPDHAFLHRLLGLTLVTVTLAACESLRWDYQIANGGDEGETAQYKPDGLLPGLEPGEAVAFCRYKEANEAQGPFASNVVEISVHDPRPGGSGPTSQALGTGFTVAGGGAGESTQGYGRGGTFEGGGRGEWTEGGGRGEWKEGHGQGAAVEPQPLVVHAHVDDPRVFRRGENFRLLFDCKNTGHHTVTEVVLITENI